MKTFFTSYSAWIFISALLISHSVLSAEYSAATFKNNSKLTENGKQIVIRSSAAFLRKYTPEPSIIIYFFSFELTDTQIQLLSKATYNSLPWVADLSFTLSDDFSKFITFGIGTPNIANITLEQYGAKDHTTTFKIDKNHIKLNSKGKRMSNFGTGSKEFLREWDLNLDIPLFHEHF